MEPNTDSPEAPLPELTHKLEADAAALAWSERLELVERAVTVLRDGADGAHAAKLLTLLARDPKWEVRKAVADHLLEAPEALYEQLIPLLANDANTFVAQSVRREMGRRSLQSAGEKRRQSRPLKRASDDIETRFGSDALKFAVRLAEKKTEQAIRAAAHDIKGILTPIKPSLDALRAAAADKVEKKRIDRIVRGVNYLEQMLASMTRWSDEIELEVAEENLAEVIEAAAQDAIDHLAAQGRNSSAVTFSLVATADPRLRLSRSQLQMAFTNLIKNGIEAHAVSNVEFASGSVSVTVSVDDQVLRVEIADTGKGMSARDLEKLLEFVPGNTSKKHLGTGYGVPIAKKYIEVHGGKLSVTSAENKGTTVVVLLPLEPQLSAKP
ncbi:MAG: hypothetical protein QOE70_4757 [Chthoniobacter sp.]|jgi:signal transduction histidine kinase|nr:hypothetical protein [Chthoniobacter sp.]